MTSLAFDLLDRHVVAGRGDEIACADATGDWSFARLLERSAALAGGLRALGVSAGETFTVQVGAGNVRVQVICACVRLGAEPAEEGAVRVVESEDGVKVHTPEHEADLDVVERAGQTDPAPSLPADAPGYADRVRDAHADVVESLLTGMPVM